MRSLVRWVLEQAYRVNFWIAQLVFEHSDVGGMDVINLDEEEDGWAGNLAGALELIEEVAPWRMAHLRKDVGNIVLTRTDVEYLSVTKSISLSHSLLNNDVDWIATTIVFMAAQARIANRRVNRRAQRGMRIIRACYEEQLAFARRLADPVPVLERLTAQWDRGWWDSAHAKRRRGRRSDQLRLPRWVRGLGDWLDH